jgi:predicted secreted hydrolase
VWSSARRLLTAALAVLALCAFTSATAPYEFHFPRDHYAHDGYRTEWWYYTGHLRAADGRRFGFEVTFFRIGLEAGASQWAGGRSKWYAYQLYPAHFAITDERGKRFVYAETFARDALGQGFASERELDVHANGWSLTGTSEVRPRMRLQASGGGASLDLTVRSEKPPAIHGRDGVSRKGACASCASHYYSFTRLLASGTLILDGARIPVTGIAWMDHEYGSDELEPGQTGWDWFALQFDDGSEAMLYRLRRRDGSTTPQSSGSLIDRAGTVRYVPLAGFSIEPDGTWRSPHTGAVYPSGWRVRVRGIERTLELDPVLRDQELAEAGGTTYWEGAVDIRDAATHALVGEGYVELTGYAGALQL